ncbi:GNAT family N-acetyltransferase [Microbacterium sp. PMB16]|uniref:GNAT family N-acetyltransferase n=1 Tax=Microbacterium sp. PMB16 TaxID=3120157 RepID=UPI003F4C528C
MTGVRDVRLASGTAGTTVHTSDSTELGRIEITVLDPIGDLDVIHEWVTRPAARFWGLAALSRDELRDLYAFVDGLPSHHAFLIRRDGLPVVLLQTYEPENDPLGEVYRPEPGDIGIHFLLGARGAPARGFTTQLGRLIGEFLFARPQVDRIVIEPDIGNDRALARVQLFGFELGPPVQLADKTGQLAFLTRERWEVLRAGQLHE